MAIGPLKVLIDSYKVARRKKDKTYTQKKFAEEIGYGQTLVSRYFLKKPPDDYIDAVLKKIRPPDPERIRGEIKAHYKRAARLDGSISLEDFRPYATAFSFDPFVRQESERPGFTPAICERLFNLSHRPFKIELVSNFDDALNWVKDPKSSLNMVLNMSETIPRSSWLHTFHSPVASPLNVVVSLGAFDEKKRQQIRDAFLKQTATEPFIAVKDEVGYSYLQDEFEPNEGMLFPIQGFSPDVIANKLRERSRKRPHLFVGDELLCLQVANYLNRPTLPREEGPTAYGLLFPLSTLAVSRSPQFARIPTYKFGLMAVPLALGNIIRFLNSSLSTLLNNDRFFVALQYRDLAVDLKNLIQQWISQLPPEAKDDLYQLHSGANEHFQFRASSPQFAEALASRVVRQTLRLNTQLIEADDDLNLPWKPILEIVRHRLLGPLPPEFRDLRFDQASVRCRVFPPFLSTDASPSHESPRKITKWSLFGPVLAQIADLVNLEDRKATIPKADSEKGPDPADPNEDMRNVDMTVGMFDVPIRSYDQHFFRFPISFRLNGLLPAVEGLPVDLKPLLRKLFRTRSKVLDSDTVNKLRATRCKIQPILLKFTAAYYLSTDWDVEQCPVKFDADTVKQLSNFKEEFSRTFDAYHSGISKGSGVGINPLPLIIADELTCFRLLPYLTAYNPELLFDPLTGYERTRYFYSMGIQRAETHTSRAWWDIMQEALPVAVAKGRTELIDEFRKVRTELSSMAQAACGRNLQAWLDEVVCLDLASSNKLWSNALLSDDWRPIILAAFLPNSEDKSG